MNTENTWQIFAHALYSRIKMAESEYHMEEVISEDSEVNWTEFMQILC